MSRFKKNDLGDHPSPQRWSDAAVICHERGCVCDGCQFSIYFRNGEKCHMKATVLELVRTVGVPNSENTISYYEGGDE